jgi:hypothetical protein
MKSELDTENSPLEPRYEFLMALEALSERRSLNFSIFIALIATYPHLSRREALLGRFMRSLGWIKRKRVGEGDRRQV